MKVSKTKLYPGGGLNQGPKWRCLPSTSPPPPSVAILYMLIPICAQFIMRNASPHMQIFLFYSPYAYGDSPYAYGGQFLMCLQFVSDLWLSHALNQNFLDVSAHPPT